MRAPEPTGPVRAKAPRAAPCRVTPAFLTTGSLTPERVFAALAALFGLAFAATSPLLDPADERRHLERAFALSEGHLYLDANYRVPRSLHALHPPYFFKTRDGRISKQRLPGSRIVCIHHLDDVAASLTTPLDPDERVGVRRPIPYGPAPYAPQALAMVAGRTRGLSAGELLYLARAANLAMWTALCWLALRILPTRKWTMVVVCLSPMALFEASTLSADAMTNASALLLLAFAVRATCDTGYRMRGLRAAALVGTCAWLGLVKPGYWPLGALVLMIPTERFGGARRRVALVGGAWCAMLACTGIWLAMLRIALPDPHGAGFDLGSVLRALSAFPAMMAELLARDGYRLLAGAVGILGHLDVVLPRWVYLAYPTALVAVALLDGDGPHLSASRRAGLVAIGIAGFACVLALLYLGAPRLELADVRGMVHGRYFLPLVPVALLALPAAKRAPRLAGPISVLAICGGTLTIAAWAIAAHYFAGTGA